MKYSTGFPDGQTSFEHRKPEIRNPKPESNPNDETQSGYQQHFDILVWGILSDFWFRVSGLDPFPALPITILLSGNFFAPQTIFLLPFRQHPVTIPATHGRAD